MRRRSAEDAVQSGVKISHVVHTRELRCPAAGERSDKARDGRADEVAVHTENAAGGSFICGMPEEPVRIHDGFRSLTACRTRGMSERYCAAEAFGADCVLWEGRGPYLYKTVRASMGRFSGAFAAVSRGELATKLWRDRRSVDLAEPHQNS